MLTGKKRHRGIHVSVDTWDLVVIDGFVASVTPTCERTLGYAHGELEARPFIDFVHPSDRARTLEALHQAEGRTIFVLENRCRCKDGAYRWFQWRLLSSPEGVSVYAVARDITDRKQLEELQACQSDVLEHIAVGKPLFDILDNICHNIDRLVPKSMSSIMLLNTTSDRLYVTAPTTLPDSIRSMLDGLIPGPLAGSCGAAAFVGKPVIATNTDTDPCWATLRYFAQTFHVKACWSIPITGKEGQTLGTFAISHPHPTSPTPFHWKLLEAASHLSGIALQRHHTEKALRESEERLQTLSKKLIDTQERERRQLAHDLHDEIGQTLTALKINLQTLNTQHTSRAAPGLLRESIEILDSMLTHVRELSLDLRPSLLDDLGLGSAVRWFVKRQADRANWTATVHIDEPLPPLRPEQATASFRVIQEAVTNAMRHAHASTVTVRLRQIQDELDMTIADNGIGFQAADAVHKASTGASFGLLSMQERIRFFQGTLEIRSSPGQGTEIHGRLPIPLPGTKPPAQ